MSESPLHGYRGEMQSPPLLKPRGLTVALTREAGGWGNEIARGVGERLGWQVFGQESLDQLVRDPAAREEILADLPHGAIEWADDQLSRLLRQRQLVQSSLAGETARLLFSLAARGEVVVVGRGAGFILPPESTLHIRVIAPRPERVRSLGDWMRLAPAEAEVEVDTRDAARDHFLKQLHDGDPHDPLLYDITLNSSRLGIETCVRIIVAAVNQRHLEPDDESDPEPA